MKSLAIDIETYSSEDLTKVGVYKYVQAADFEIMLLAYSLNGGEVQIIDLASGEPFPYSLLTYLKDPGTLKTAHNAAFERTCLAAYLGLEMPPDQWSCTMAKASQVGLPLSLDAVARVLQLSEQKSDGKALIRYFSLPCKPTKVNGGRTRNLSEHDPEKWQRFKDYCTQDVRVEQAIRSKIEWFNIPASEVKLWNLDQHINDHGVLVDPVFVNQAISLDQDTREMLTAEAVQITGLGNPNSVAQLKTWLTAETDAEISTLTKDATKDLITKVGEGPAKRVLEIRQKMSRSSVKKYSAMIKGLCSDNRVRGLLQYYGANRTGRWCLAEGTKVLTKNTHTGQVSETPVQTVTTDELVFDGLEWVTHEGVVFSGLKDCIEWDGVQATPEHIVWISGTEKMTLQEAKDKNLNLWKGNTEYTK